MDSISSALASYAAQAALPVSATAPVSASNDSDDTQQASASDNSTAWVSDNSDDNSPAPSNATDLTPAVYTALASASTSNIRGTSVNTSA